MLLLATVALLLPAMFLLAHGGELPQLEDEATNFPSDVEHMSFAVAIVLLLSYFAGLWFSLRDPPRRLQSGQRGRDAGGRVERAGAACWCWPAPASRSA